MSSFKKEKFMQFLRRSFGLSLFTLVISGCFTSKAAEPQEQAIIDINTIFANKVVIVNKSKYPINVLFSDPNYSLRLAAKSYKPLGEIPIDTVLRRKMTITEFGHSGENQAKGQKVGEIPLSRLIEEKKGEHKIGTAFFVIINDPAGYGITRLYSDWTNRYETKFAIPTEELGPQRLPAGKSVFAIQDFKGINDQIGAVAFGYYSSVDQFSKQNPKRFARVELGLPQTYTKGSIDIAVERLRMMYDKNNFQMLTRDEDILIQSIDREINDAVEQLLKEK